MWGPHEEAWTSTEVGQGQRGPGTPGACPPSASLHKVGGGLAPPFEGMRSLCIWAIAGVIKFVLAETLKRFGGFFGLFAFFFSLCSVQRTKASLLTGAEGPG